MTSRVSEQVTHEAAAWLAVLSDPACTAEERRDFTRWLKRSSLNVEEFLALSLLTRRLEKLPACSSEDSMRWIEQARQVPTQIARLPAPERPPPRVRPLRWSWPVAAAAAIVLAISGLVLDQRGRLERQTYATGLGELRSVVLEDGSIVQLDAQSQVRARFQRNERAVELQRGTAIFNVAHDRSRPFRVSTGNGDIVAVGTAFNVAARDGRTIVTVIEGRVRVQPATGMAGVSGSAPFELDPGQQVVLAGHAADMRLSRVDPGQVTAWTARRLYFEDTPISEAVEAFARYSARGIRIEDQALARRRITGAFDATDPASLVEFLGRDASVTVVEAADGWRVLSRR